MAQPTRPTFNVPLYWGAIVFVVLACLSLVGIDGLRSWKARETRIEAIYRETANLASSLSQQATSTLQTTDAVLLDIADRYGQGGLDASQVQVLRTAMMARLASFPLIHGLFIYDETGNAIVTSVPGAQPRFNNSDRAYFVYHKANLDVGLHIGNPVKSKTDGGWIITITRRLNRPDGSFNGVVQASISVDYFRGFYDQFDVGRHGVINLARDDGITLFRKPFDEATLGTSIAGGAIFRQFLPNSPAGSTVSVSVVDQVERFVSYRRVDDYPLVIIVALSTDEALANWYNAAIQSMTIALIVAVVLAALGARVARQVRQRHRAEQAMTVSEASYRLLADNASDLVVKIREDGPPLYASPSAIDILGYEPEQLMARPYIELIHPDDVPRVGETLNAAREQGRGGVALRVRHRNGHYVWLETNVKFVVADGGFVVVCRDVTERIAIESRLAETRGDLETRRHMIDLIGRLAQRLPCCTDLTEFASAIERFMPQIMPGVAGVLYLADERSRLQFAAHWHQRERAAAPGIGMNDCWALRRGQVHICREGGAELICPHHSPSATAYSCVPLVAQEKTVGLLYFHAAIDANDRDINMLTETIALALVNLRLRDHLREQSVRDQLTGLFNRRYLEESLQVEIARSRRTAAPLAVLMIDADHFKKLNDTRGHDAGDFVLSEIGALLRSQFREGDIACRYGGEEFTVVMPGTDLGTAMLRAENLRAAMEGLRLWFKGATIGLVTLSIGVAMMPSDGGTPEELIASADKALYEAKQAGRNRVAHRGPLKLTAV